jgi:hypothetical protein
VLNSLDPDPTEQIIVAIEASVDMNRNYRRLFERIHGYMPGPMARRCGVLVGVYTFIGGVLCSKLIAVSALVAASPFVARYVPTGMPSHADVNSATWHCEPQISPL